MIWKNELCLFFLRWIVVRRKSLRLMLYYWFGILVVSFSDILVRLYWSRNFSERNGTLNESFVHWFPWLIHPRKVCRRSMLCKYSNSKWKRREWWKTFIRISTGISGASWSKSNIRSIVSSVRKCIRKAGLRPNSANLSVLKWEKSFFEWKCRKVWLTLNSDRQAVCSVGNPWGDIPYHRYDSVFRRDQHMWLVVDWWLVLLRISLDEVERLLSDEMFRWIFSHCDLNRIHRLFHRRILDDWAWFD